MLVFVTATGFRTLSTKDQKFGIFLAQGFGTVSNRLSNYDLFLTSMAFLEQYCPLFEQFGWTYFTAFGSNKIENDNIL